MEAEFAGTNRFELRRRLGAGGMGVVYKAYDRERRELVALKTLRRFDAAALHRFKNEFRALQGIDHPNVVGLGELIEDGGDWFFTMELVDGTDFLAYVRPGAKLVALADTMLTPAALLSGDRTDSPQDAADGGVFDEAKLRESLKQLAQGIAALHTADKVHRDIKPSNIIVTKAGRVVLLDFGLVADTDGSTRSSSSDVVGTAEYMAPEQSLAGGVGPPADWYSMGVLLYQALTGALPYTGKSAFDVLMKKQQYPAPPPRQLVSDVPEDLDALCVDLLGRDPSHRPPTALILERLGVRLGDIALGVSSTSSVFSQSTPFVGRAEELASMRRAFDDSCEGAAVTMFVHGASGMGKSELVRTFTTELTSTRRDVVVLRGRCYERETVPYKAFDGIADALSDYMMLLPDDDAALLIPLRAGLLASLFPVMQRVRAIAQAPLNATVSVDPQERRRRMFSAFREVLVRLSQRKRLVLVIDDFQWAGADSATMLTAVMNGDDAPEMLVLVTARAGLDERKLSDSIFGDVRHVQLGELSEAQATTLVTLLMPRPDDARVAAIAHESQGHPLFIMELVRGLEISDSGEVLRLDDALWNRVCRLPSQCRDVLEMLVVAGVPVAQRVVCNALGLRYGEYEKAASTLRVGFLARTSGARSSDSIEPFHDRVRESVVANLSDEVLVQRHLQLAISLERAGAANTDPHLLVLHFEAAGDTARAAQHAQAAAVRATELSAFDQAAAFYDVAIRLGDLDKVLALNMRMARAEVLVNAGRGPMAAEVFLDAARYADTAQRLVCHMQAGQQLLITGYIDRGKEVLDALLAQIGEPLSATPRRALLSLLGYRLRLKLRRFRWQERPESDIPLSVRTHLDALKAAAQGLSLVDNVRGADFNARFLLMALRTGDASRVAIALAADAALLGCQGGRATVRGRAVAKRVQDIAAQHPGDPYIEPVAALADGMLSFFESRFRTAESGLAEVVDAFCHDTIGTTWERNTARVFRMFAERMLGSLGQSRSLLNTYVHDAQQRGDRYLETTVVTWSATQPMLALDDADGASERLDGLDWAPADHGFHIQHWFEAEARAEIAIYRGTAARELAGLDRTLVLLSQSMLLRIQPVRVLSNSTHGRLLLAAGGDHAQSALVQRKLRKIVARLHGEKVGYATVLAELLSAGAACVGPSADRGKSVAFLRAAIDVATEKEMMLYVATAQRRLGQLLGGDDGAGLLAASDAWMAQERVVDPERLTETMVPGIDTSGL